MRHVRGRALSLCVVVSVFATGCDQDEAPQAPNAVNGGGPEKGSTGARGAGSDGEAGSAPGSEAGTVGPASDAGGHDADASSASACGTSPAGPAPALGAAYYFSDCQSGAAAGCVPGNDANAGTSPDAPKRTLAGFDVNALPAGTQLLFARGGAWTGFNVVVENPNATPTSPIVFDSYAPSWGGTAAPWLKAGGAFYAFQFGAYASTLDDGGYIVRHLKLDGLGADDSWGIWLRDDVHHVLIDDLEITGFELGLHIAGASPGVTFVTVRNSNIHHNAGMGMLGHADDMLFEGNTFASNNFSGSGFNHGMYISGHGQRAVVRNNRFENNSTVNGTCTGGNVTVHGRWDGMLFEGNTIVQAASDGGCYGFSINAAYDTPEYLRNVVVRGNTVVNVGNCSVCATSAPGIIVENNVFLNTQPRYHAAVLIPDRPTGPGDAQDTGAIVRNNTIYLTQANAGEAIALRPGSGSGQQVVSNLIYYGAGASAQNRCFAHQALSSFTAFANNLCHFAGSAGTFSASFATLAAAQSAGFNAGGSSAAPLLVAAPSAANGFDVSVQAASPAVDAGHPTLSTAVDRACRARTQPDIGASER